MSATRLSQPFKIVINGKKSLNGERYSITIDGEIGELEDDVTFFDIARQLVDEAETHCVEMAFPDSMRLTIYQDKTKCNS